MWLNEVKGLHLKTQKLNMDPVLIKVIQFFLSLSLLIVLHELGHFIPARLFGTRVEKFFLFFDIKFALFKKKIGETVYDRMATSRGLCQNLRND